MKKIQILMLKGLAILSASIGAVIDIAKDKVITPPSLEYAGLGAMNSQEGLSLRNAYDARIKEVCIARNIPLAASTISSEELEIVLSSERHRANVLNSRPDGPDASSFQPHTR